MTTRLCDESVVVDLPKFVAAYANAFPCAARVTHICDLYDTALCLRVLWILYHSHVQFFLAFAECDDCCAITRGDLKYVYSALGPMLNAPIGLASGCGCLFMRSSSM